MSDGQYRAANVAGTATPLTDGKTCGPPLVDAQGRLLVNVGATSGGASGGASIADPTPRTRVTSTALESSRVLKASAGTHCSTHVTLDATAPTGTYYLQMLVAASVPADGAVTHFHAPRTVIHTLGIPDEIVWDDEPAGVAFATGLCVVLSSTQLTKTIAGAYLLVDGSVL